MSSANLSSRRADPESPRQGWVGLGSGPTLPTVRTQESSVSTSRITLLKGALESEPTGRKPKSRAPERERLKWTPSTPRRPASAPLLPLLFPPHSLCVPYFLRALPTSLPSLLLTHLSRFGSFLPPQGMGLPEPTSVGPCRPGASLSPLGPGKSEKPRKVGDLSLSQAHLTVR